MSYHVSWVFQMPGDKQTQRSIGLYSDAGDNATVIKNASKLGILMQGMQGAQTKLRRIRVSPLGSTRRVKGVKFVAEANQDETVTVDTDIGKTCVELFLAHDEDAQVRLSFPGIPDVCVNKGSFKANDSFTRGLKAFTTEVTKAASSWWINVLDPADVWKPINQITNAGVITIPGHGLAENNVVRLSGVVDYRNSNGTYRIVDVQDDTFKLSNWGAVRAGDAFLEQGRIRRQNKVLLSVTKVFTGDACGRDTGKLS